MTSDPDIKKQVESQGEGKGKVEPRLVFVSHSHADRNLAAALGSLVETVFSGVVKAFVSSDPGPTGGIMPGEQWFSQIEGNLRQAEAVWVLATPTSITRPWIYWEAGIGRAICSKGVVVLRAGLAPAQVPSPLNSFQSYDGLDRGEVAQLVSKVANQIGMTLPQVLTEASAKTWVEAAEHHQPLVREDVEEVPTLTPERLDRLDAAIARLEAVSILPATERRARTARQRTADRHIQAGRDMLGSIPHAVHKELEELVEVVEREPSETTFEVTGIDPDGDAVIVATSHGETATMYLHSSQLPLVEDREELPDRTRRLLTEVARVRDEAAGPFAT